MESYYDVAQICLNGHKITATYNRFPQHRAEYCDQCGESTITECQNCNTQIRGRYHIPGVIGLNDYQVPSYCHNCGQPYPWTQKIIDNAVTLIALDEGLPEQHKEVIKNSFPDLIVETPTTPLAVARYKKYIDGAEGYVKEGLKDLLKRAVNEAVAKAMWG